MDWAYRMIAAHSLDPLGMAVVLHLGWRDAANQRTDRGIAAALHQHRSSIQKATAKLAALGVIVRRSGQWVAAETVAIVEERPDAKRPGRAADDGEGGPLSRPAHSVGRGGPLSRPQVAHSVGHKRKENIEKGGTGAAKALTDFQKARIAAGQSVVIAGAVVAPGSPQMAALRRSVRAQGA